MIPVILPIILFIIILKRRFFMFADRKEAGKRLAEKLEKYRKRENVLVLAIPRGGVQVGYQVAKYLNADFSILISRKLPYPYNPEAGFGAIAEDGSTFLFPHAEFELPGETINEILISQQDEIKRRIETLRKGKPLPAMEGKTVILVDDGIAMGSTMRASIKCCRNQGAGRIVVGTPVAGERGRMEIGQLVDEIVVVEEPINFRAVAQVYQNWYDVPDEEVLEIMKKWEHKA
jgi:predicted phosphoribosyltransferase